MKILVEMTFIEQNVPYVMGHLFIGEPLLSHFPLGSKVSLYGVLYPSLGESA